MTLGLKGVLIWGLQLTQEATGGLCAVDSINPVQGEGEGSIRAKCWLGQIGRDDWGSGADALCAQCLGSSSPCPH